MAEMKENALQQARRMAYDFSDVRAEISQDGFAFFKIAFDEVRAKEPETMAAAEILRAAVEETGLECTLKFEKGQATLITKAEDLDLYHLANGGEERALPAHVLFEKIKTIKNQLETGWEKDEAGRYRNLHAFNAQFGLDAGTLCQALGDGQDAETLLRVTRETREDDTRIRFTIQFVTETEWHEARQDARSRKDEKTMEALRDASEVGICISEEGLAELSRIIGFANPLQKSRMC